MSALSPYAVDCDCGASVEMECCDTINAEREPALRDAVMNRTLHVAECGACGQTIVVDKELMYLDLPRKQFYNVARDCDREDERALCEDLVAAWQVTLGDRAPVSVSSMFRTDQFHLRQCFGLEELREKLVVCDEKLDDLALEIFKGELMAANPDWANAAVRTLRLDHVESDGRLAFYLERATVPLSVLELGVLAEPTRYQQLARTPWRELLDSHPWVASGPHVSMLRLSLPSVAAASEA